jgi:hypothetical protein
MKYFELTLETFPLLTYEASVHSKYQENYPLPIKTAISYYVLMIRKQNHTQMTILFKRCLFYYANENFYTIRLRNIYSYMRTFGTRGGIVFKALRYQIAGLGFDSRWCHWNFSVT